MKGTGELMENKRVQTWFFAAVFILLLVGVAKIFSPFFTVFLWSTLIYIMTSPLYHWMIGGLDPSRRTTRLTRYFVAGIFSILSVVIIVVPLGFILVKLIRQLSSLIRDGLVFLNGNPDFLASEVAVVTRFFSDLGIGVADVPNFNLKNSLSEALSGSIETLMSFTTEIIRNIGQLIVSLLFMVFILFFFYIDSYTLLKVFVRAIPIRSDYMKQLMEKFRDITRSLFFGYILVAVGQSLVAFLIFSLFRVDGSLALTMILFFCSFIPMIGTAAVWGPIGVLRIIGGDFTGGIVFLVLSAIFISSLDNVLRPLLLKDRLKLHPLIIFFSILGGIAVFGFNGLILGPMIVILFLTALDLFLIENDMPDKT